jgi:hypothetical protein
MKMNASETSAAHGIGMALESNYCMSMNISERSHSTIERTWWNAHGTCSSIVTEFPGSTVAPIVVDGDRRLARGLDLGLFPLLEDASYGYQEQYPSPVDTPQRS